MRVLIATCREYVKHGMPLAKDDQILLALLRSQGIEVQIGCWDDPSVHWERADIVVLRSTWDYFHHIQEFIRWTRHIQQVSQLYNPLEAVVWNSNKQYLRALDTRGIPIIPTLWLSQGGCYNLADLVQRQQWSEFVLKPVISANSHKTLPFDSSQIIQAQRWLDDIVTNHSGAMLQPYLKSVTQGEISHVFIDGQWNHAFMRIPFTLNRPEHQLAGRIFQAAELSPTDLELAHHIYHAIEAETRAHLLYARVDLVSGGNSQTMLMEAEMIEPVLRLEVPGAGERFVAGLLKRAALLLA